MGGLGGTSFCSGLWEDFVVCYQRKWHGQRFNVAFLVIRVTGLHRTLKKIFFVGILVKD